MKSSVTVDAVADYILWVFHEQGKPIDHLKLQKLVYYVQAWHLALYDEPLFPEHLEAWVNGPVQPGLYRRFKKWYWEPIEEKPECPDLPESVKDHINEVLNVYGDYPAERLEYNVHREMPWVKARNGVPPLEPCTAVISNQDMMDFFERMGRQ
ncbi:MAG: type II toxin-antitoxin system antitoxin SocA domain-containing protein [Pseudomonadota bacterium]